MEISRSRGREKKLRKDGTEKKREQMTQTEKLSKKFNNEVGVDLNNQFENQVYGTIMGLIESLENLLIDNETKVDYATHVFAKALDEMVDYLESPWLLN